MYNVPDGCLTVYWRTVRSQLDRRRKIEEGDVEEGIKENVPGTVFLRSEESKWE